MDDLRVSRAERDENEESVVVLLLCGEEKREDKGATRDARLWVPAPRNSSRALIMRFAVRAPQIENGSFLLTSWIPPTS